jgi:hypothetical protein
MSLCVIRYTGALVADPLRDTEVAGPERENDGATARRRWRRRFLQLELIRRPNATPLAHALSLPMMAASPSAIRSSVARWSRVSRA